MWLDAEFKEEEHPRGQPANKGQFSSAPGGGNSAGAGEPERGAEEAGGGASAGKAKGKIAPKQKQVEGAVELSGYLRKLASIHKMPGGMKSPAQFLLDHGYPYVANAKTYEGPRDPMHECYKNATLAALSNKDRAYVEGYVVVHGVPIEHAWTVDKTGQIYDSTINPDQGISGYFGIPFKKDYVLAAGLLNKKYGLLGFESRKTLEPLLKGEAENFRAEPDPDSLTPSAIADRISYADAVVRSIPPTDKIDTPERKKLRKEIADKLYNKDIGKRSRNREATIILGLPGIGKSTFARPLLDKGYLEVDPDLAKSQLPEYGNGIGAFAVHEESSAITRSVLEQAITNGDDFVWPRIDSPDKVVKDLKSLKDAGYKVNVQFLDGSYQDAMKNAVHRFLTTGRYVSMEAIKDYGDSPRMAYEAAVKSGLLDNHESYKSTPGRQFEKIEK
jgi:predicted ABC-type ATPase